MSMQYPGQVEFACVEGFQISEETVSYCRGDGEWETGVTCTGKLSILCQCSTQVRWSSPVWRDSRSLKRQYPTAVEMGNGRRESRVLVSCQYYVNAVPRSGGVRLCGGIPDL